MLIFRHFNPQDFIYALCRCWLVAQISRRVSSAGTGVGNGQSSVVGVNVTPSCG